MPEDQKSTGKVNKRLAQQEKSQKLQQQAKRRSRLKKYGFFAAGLLITVIIIVMIATKKPLPGEKVAIMDDQTHIPSVTSPHIPYSTDPPTSGQHIEQIAPWGVHKEAVPKEVLVHNLEDGGIVIYYNSKVNEETAAKLEKIVEGYPDHVIVAPYPEMKEPIVLTAWGRIDRLNEFEEERIKSFIKAYKGIDHHK